MKERILITVKTYPTLSKKHGELVCTTRQFHGWASNPFVITGLFTPPRDRHRELALW